MEIRPKELKFGRTVAAYYAALFAVVAVQVLMIALLRFGPHDPVWQNPKIHRMFRHIAGAVALAAPLMASLAVLARRHARRRHWLISNDGVKILLDSHVVATLPWERITGAFYARNGVVHICVRARWLPLKLPGIDRQIGQAFVDTVVTGIESRRSAQQHAGG